PKKEAKKKEEKKEEPPPQEPKDEAPVDDEPPKADEPEGLFLSKPQNVMVESGKDVTVSARVAGAALPVKPVVKWFKGKWAEMNDKTARCRLRQSVDNDKVRATAPPRGSPPT
ncbi:myosin-binding protein C, fast-type-like, partial [Coturnix japonica]|uniref:myosin-binding protein C, fast-type-like n=1 Tax=Coturnix japonica TaxID=93934 RepID=UPI0013A5D8DB